ncbi:YIP1 family protein [Clostridium sp. D2Q-11]|uniref:YIP1 family protein n=1 Tax=Anaeromonas frigoriresistens TaxID=2683708 RepID=A0A942Z9P9_9FIRM|nr:Yip1 family protein [Anaeromonas frigoriresistens]MBS4539060.1 YIP1 family protein [Anaeromonas frigoriresistens]
MNEKDLMNEKDTINENQSIFERIKYYLIKPNKFFQNYKENPKVAIHLIILLIISSITAVITKNKAMSAVDENFGGLSGQELESVKNITNIVTSPAAIILMTIVFSIITYLLFALFRYIFVKLVHGEGRFKQMFAIVLVTSYPVTIVALIKSFLPLDAEVSMLDSFLSKVNIFSIWQLVLLIIGMSVVFNISKKKSIIINIVIFLVSLSFILGGTYLNSMATTMIQ